MLSSKQESMMVNMRVLSYRDLADLGIAYSRPHIERMTREGKFPQAFAQRHTASHGVRQTSTHGWRIALRPLSR
jgi:hypothetical protein